MSKVLFVVPPYSHWGVEAIGTWPPLQIAYLAGSVKQAGHEARIVDAMNMDGATFDTISKAIEDFTPDVVVAYDYLPVTGAISTAVVPAAMKCLALAKAFNPATVTVIGGPFPTFKYPELFKESPTTLDYVLRGEAEETLPELLEALKPGGKLSQVKGIAYLLNGHVTSTESRGHAPDLDVFRPAYELLDWKLYRYKIDPPARMASVLTSRGCMMGCSFCSHRAFWRKDWRARKPELVMNEVRELVEKYKVEAITLIDPYPTFDAERWEHLLDLFIEAKLPVNLLMETRVEDIIRDEAILHKYRKAGVVHLYLGAEGSTDEMLGLLNKGANVSQNERAIRLAQAHDIVVEASFMIGHATETWESVARTIEVAKRMNPDIAVFPVLTPMPFTPLYTEMKDRIRVHDFSKYNLSTPIIEPHAMSLEDVNVALGRCYMEFYGTKMREMHALPEGFKRRYLLSAAREMMKAYKHHFAHLGKRMPAMPHHDFL